MAENTEAKKSGLGTAGMVLGIIAICFSVIPIINYFSVVLGVLATIFSAVALIKKTSKGQAIAGLVLGIVSVIFVVQSYVALKEAVNTVSSGFGEVTNSFTNGLNQITDSISEGVNKIQDTITVDENSPDKMTMEKFNKIETGMTYEQVVAIVGSEGELSTESSYGSYSMKIYSWKASNGIANATVSFTNGKVSGKSQIGL